MGRFDCERCGGYYSPYENKCYYCGFSFEEYIKIGPWGSKGIQFVSSNSKIFHKFYGWYLRRKGYKKIERR